MIILFLFLVEFHFVIKYLYFSSLVNKRLFGIRAIKRERKDQ